MMHDIFNDKLEAMSLDPSAKARMKRLFKDTTEEFVSSLPSNSSATTSSTDRERSAVSNITEAYPVSTLLLSPYQDFDGQPLTAGSWDSCVDLDAWNDDPFHYHTLGAGGESPSLFLDPVRFESWDF